MTCSFAAPIKSRDPALVSLLTESSCVANNDDNRRPRDIVTTRSPELDNSLSKTRWQLQQDHSELSYPQHITHISKSLMYTHENSTGQKGSRLWCSHDFRPRSIVRSVTHMMIIPVIIHRATNEEQSLVAHDEKSQGWC